MLICYRELESFSISKAQERDIQPHALLHPLAPKAACTARVQSALENKAQPKAPQGTRWQWDQGMLLTTKHDAVHKYYTHPGTIYSCVLEFGSGITAANHLEYMFK